MGKATCYYIVKARTAFQNNQTKEIEFNAVEKRFENVIPILAREAAFKFRNEFIYGMLSDIGFNDDAIGWNIIERKFDKLSDREVRQLINPYLEPDNNSSKTTLRTENHIETEIEWEAPNDGISWYNQYNNGIWVILKHNDEELIEAQDLGEIVIDKVSRYEGNLPTPPLYSNLAEELEFYEKYNYDTKTYKTTVTFFDDESYLEGGENEEQALKDIDILETPFDWTGYDTIYWWDEQKQKEVSSQNELLDGMNIAFAKGEHEYAEFKPGMINRQGSSRDIEYEVAKTIAAFLNANGGYLFIGVADKGQEIIGLNSERSKDEFLREFTRIKSRYLPAFIAHTIFGDFYHVDDKEIFVVTVYPCQLQPIFLRKNGKDNRVIKEFFVRSDASSRHLYDLDDLWKYCTNKWK